MRHLDKELSDREASVAEAAENVKKLIERGMGQAKPLVQQDDECADIRGGKAPQQEISTSATGAGRLGERASTGDPRRGARGSRQSV